jgi:3-isopropylmalate/(R)-2-methylmalate dehydratase large subunit
VGSTAAEKILARACGLERVRAGEIVYPAPDFVIIHDGVVMGAKQELDALGIDRLFDPDRVMMVTDHDVVYLNERAVARGAFNRQAAAAWGVKAFYDAGQGGHGHIFPTERGLLLPGMFYFDNDRHCTNAGGIGALAIRVGAEIGRVLATGTTWTLVPKSIRVTLKGVVQPGVYARDIGFHLGRTVRERGIDLDYRVLEFAGEIEQLALCERVALCSTPTEMRAIGVFFPPSAQVLEYARARAKRPFIPVYPDADAAYDAELTIDVSALEPQVALPGAPHKAANLSDVAGTKIDHAFIGSCGSGMYEDLEAAAAILRTRRVAPGVRLLVVPGSEESTRRLHREGLLDVFQQAGAFVLPAGCGPCASGRMGLMHSGEVSICTATANAPGRFGAKDAHIYLGSPATVAASAVTGRITDPRTLQ